MRYTILAIFLVWAGWASFSSGGLYELKQMNPEYPHPKKSLPYLLSKLGYGESNGFWDSYHVENCSFYMPNWNKAERCVRRRISCEFDAPKEKYSSGARADIFSEEFRSCWKDNRPFRGPVWWLRASRSLWRGGILAASMWLTGGWDAKGDAALKWDDDNKGWVKPVFAWVEQGS